MVRQITAIEFEARALALLDEVWAGEEIEITRHDKVVARLVRARGARSLRGRLAGVARSVNDDESLLSKGALWELP